MCVDSPGPAESWRKELRYTMEIDRQGTRFDSNLIATFEMICQYAVQMIRVDHSGFVRFDSLQQTGEVVAEYPPLGDLVGQQLRLRGVPAEDRLLDDDRPLVINDVAGATDLGEVQPLLRRYGIQSLCIVKVRFNGAVIGSFSLDSIRAKRAFTEEEIELCRSFAAFASEMIAARQLAGWLEAFHGATVAVTSERQIDPLLRTIVDQAKRLFNTKKVGLYQRKPDEIGQDSLWLAACSEPELKGRRLAKAEGMAWQLLLSAEPYMTTKDYDSYEHRAPGYEGVFGSVLEVPILRQDERIGIIYLSDARGRTFTDFDARLLQHFADIATIALQQTALVDRMRTLSVASADISANFDSESLAQRLTAIARHTTEILSAEMCGVFLLDPTGKLFLRASHGHRPDAPVPTDAFDVQDEPGAGLTGAIFARLRARHGKRWALGDGGMHDEPIAFNAHGRKLVDDPAVKTGKDVSPSGECFSLLAMPLLSREQGRERVVGMLRISNKKGADGRPNQSIQFNAEDIWVLRIFTESIVIAIQSARLFEELRQQKDLYARLLETWNTLASEESLETRLERIARNVVSIAGASFCRILLAESSDEYLAVKAAVLNPVLADSIRWNPQGRTQTPITDWPRLKEALTDGRPYERLEGDENLARLTDLLELRDAETNETVPIRSLFAVPMMVADRPIGLLSVGELRQVDVDRRGLRREDKNLVSSIATQATFMIDREWRMESIQRARQGVHQLARALALGDQRIALQMVVDGILEATQSDVVTLYTVRPTDGEIVGRATTTPLRNPQLNVRPAAVSAVGRVLSRDDLHTAEDATKDHILGGNFVVREGIKSSLGMPIWLKDASANGNGRDGGGRLTVGVLFVNYRNRHTFTKEDKDAVNMFAHLAAVTIRNRDLFEREQRKALTEEALREAARVLTVPPAADDRAHVDIRDTLDIIAREAHRVAIASGRSITSVVVSLVESQRYVAFSTWPREYERERRAQLWRMTDPIDGETTFVTRTFNTGVTSLVSTNTTAGRSFATIREDTLSQLTVAIGDGPQRTGVIVVESADAYGLEEGNKKTFEFFATLAFDAIRTARQRADLFHARKREKELSDLAFFYLKSGVLVHKRKGDVREFIRWAGMLRWRAEREGFSAKLLEDFQAFEDAATTFNDLLVSTSTQVEPFPTLDLNEFLKDWERRLREDRTYENITLTFEVGSTRGLLIRADPDLLRELLAILCSNARNAMLDSDLRLLTVATSITTSKQCLIKITDTGKGIDASALDADGMFLRTDNARATGTGFGMPTAQLIATRFSGEILKPRTNSTGTTNTIALPSID